MGVTERMAGGGEIERVEGVDEHAVEAAVDLELSDRRARRVRHDLRHEQDRVLLALVELLAQLVLFHRGVDVAAVPVEVDDRRDGAVFRGAVVMRDEREHRRVALRAPRHREGTVHELEVEGDPARAGAALQDARPLDRSVDRPVALALLGASDRRRTERCRREDAHQRGPPREKGRVRVRVAGRRATHDHDSEDLAHPGSLSRHGGTYPARSARSARRERARRWKKVRRRPTWFPRSHGETAADWTLMTFGRTGVVVVLAARREASPPLKARGAGRHVMYLRRACGSRSSSSPSTSVVRSGSCCAWPRDSRSAGTRCTSSR